MDRIKKDCLLSDQMGVISQVKERTKPNIKVCGDFPACFVNEETNFVLYKERMRGYKGEK